MNTDSDEINLSGLKLLLLAIRLNANRPDRSVWKTELVSYDPCRLIYLSKINIFTCLL